MPEDIKSETLDALYAPGLASAAGIAGVFEATREFVTDHLKPEIMTVADPASGAEVLVIVGNGGVRPVSADFFDGNLDAPRYRRGTAAMTTLDSFIAHVNRFGDDDTAVFADDSKTAPKLTAVLDYHRTDFERLLGDWDSEPPTDAPSERSVGEFRHGKHRTTFAFPLSEEWKAWNKANTVVMTMGDFATFLEDRLADIAGAGDDYPEYVERLVEESGGPDRIATYAGLMELARGLQVYENGQVEEAVNLASGEGSIRFSVEHETRDRKGGSVKVPKLFFIAIPIFSKGPFYRIAARLRYRKTSEGLKFWFDLYRADRSFDHALEEAVLKVDAETPAAIFYGAAEV